MPLHILVTGGAGFIGSHLTRRLLARGDRVTVLDDFNDFYDPARKRENVAPLLGRADYRLVEGDIRDEAPGGPPVRRRPLRRRGASRRPGGGAAQPAGADPLRGRQLHRHPRLLEAARRHGPKTFLFGSSSSVYGINEKVPFAETDEVNQPISPYATTKRAGELLCYNYHHLYGFRTACLRFFTVYGPRAAAGDGDPQVHRPDLAGPDRADVRRRRQPARLHLRRRHRRRPGGDARPRPRLRDPQPRRRGHHLARRPRSTGSPRSLPSSPGSNIFPSNPGTFRSPTPTFPRRRGSWATRPRFRSGKACAASSPGTASAPKRAHRPKTLKPFPRELEPT